MMVMEESGTKFYARRLKDGPEACRGTHRPNGRRETKQFWRTTMDYHQHVVSSTSAETVEMVHILQDILQA